MYMYFEVLIFHTIKWISNLNYIQSLFELHLYLDRQSLVPPTSHPQCTTLSPHCLHPSCSPRYRSTAALSPRDTAPPDPVPSHCGWRSRWQEEVRTPLYLWKSHHYSQDTRVITEWDSKEVQRSVGTYRSLWRAHISGPPHSIVRPPDTPCPSDPGFRTPSHSCRSLSPQTYSEGWCQRGH